MTSPPDGPTRQESTFTVGDLTFGVDVQNVHEVIRAQRMTMVPMAPAVVRGLINLRGKIVTAVDMRARLLFPPLESEDEPMNVVVHSDEGAVSLLVDEIGDVLNVEQSLRDQVPPGLSPVVAELAESVYKLEGEILLVLDPNAIATIVSVPSAA